MPKKQTLTITSTAIRHMPQFSRLLTIPLDKIAPWKIDQTTVVEASVNGVNLGRRSIKRWDNRDCWWIDLLDPLCQKAKIHTGDEVELTISSHRKLCLRNFNNYSLKTNRQNRVGTR